MGFEIDIIQLSMLMLLTMGGMMFLFEWKKSRKEELELRKKELQEGVKAAKINVHNDNSATEQNSVDLNGYAFIAIPEDKKSVFSEMLKGFEEYAKLKGYKVSLSVDTSTENHIGFKFTLHDEGVSVSTKKVKEDINEYINTVMSGGDFSKMPVLVTPEEHSAVIGVLKARIKYMEYTHALEKENTEFYRGLINTMANNSINHSPANINLIQEGIGMDSRSYSANNSANVIQGDENRNKLENSSIQIGKNVSEINAQLGALQDVIDHINEKAHDNEELKPVVRHLENTKEELEESSDPDSSMIGKWLGKANAAIKTANATADTIEKFNGLLESFGISI